MKSQPKIGAIVSLYVALVPGAAAGLELQGDITACHDPSRILPLDGRYYVYSTAPNVNVRSSADFVNWVWEDRPFDYATGIPPWMEAIAPGDNLWAPDVIETPGGRFLMFYSRNLGSDMAEHSVLGYASADLLAGPWEDHGELIDVVLFDANYRVIDPAPIYDDDGRLWVSVGSFGAPNSDGYDNGGIRLFELDPETGARVNPGDDGTRIAGSWIEAAYLYRRDGYYYLFFNQAACCAGLNSSYFIRVGRSVDIQGPYTDLDGRSLLTPTSGGTLFMGREFDANFTGPDNAATPRPNAGSIGRELGPGHAGIHVGSDGIERMTYHYYDAGTANGEPTLGLKSIVWGVDGWPRAGWELRDGTYAIRANLAAEGLTGPETLGGAEGPSLTTYTGTELWDVTRVDVNRFTLALRESGLELAVNAGETVLETPSQEPSHRWFAEQTNDGAFRLWNEGEDAVLEAAEASVTTAAYTGAGTQRWFFVPAGAFRIRSALGDSYLTAEEEAVSGAVQAARSEDPAQHWWLLPRADGSVEFVNLGSGLALGLEADASVVQQPPSGAETQRFQLDGLTDGSLRIVPKASGRTLSVGDAAAPLGARVVETTWLHTLEQQWHLEFIDGADAPPPELLEPATDPEPPGTEEPEDTPPDDTAPDPSSTASGGGSPGGGAAGAGTGGTPSAAPSEPSEPVPPSDAEAPTHPTSSEGAPSAPGPETSTPPSATTPGGSSTVPAGGATGGTSSMLDTGGAGGAPAGADANDGSGGCGCRVNGTSRDGGVPGSLGWLLLGLLGRRSARRSKTSAEPAEEK